MKPVLAFAPAAGGGDQQHQLVTLWIRKEIERSWGMQCEQEQAEHSVQEKQLARDTGCQGTNCSQSQLEFPPNSQEVHSITPASLNAPSWPPTILLLVMQDLAPLALRSWGTSCPLLWNGLRRDEWTLSCIASFQTWSFMQVLELRNLYPEKPAHRAENCGWSCPADPSCRPILPWQPQAPNQLIKTFHMFTAPPAVSQEGPVIQQSSDDFSQPCLEVSCLSVLHHTDDANLVLPCTPSGVLEVTLC